MSLLKRDVRTVLGVFAILLAVAGFILTLVLNADQNSRFKTERLAQQAAQRTVQPIVCRLVIAYTHPVAGTDQTQRADQIDLAWAQIGRLVGCPGLPPIH